MTFSTLSSHNWVLHQKRFCFSFRVGVVCICAFVVATASVQDCDSITPASPISLLTNALQCVLQRSI